MESIVMSWRRSRGGEGSAPFWRPLHRAKMQSLAILGYFGHGADINTPFRADNRSQPRLVETRTRGPIFRLSH